MDPGVKKKNLSYLVIGVFIILVLLVLGVYLRFGIDLRPCTQKPNKPLESTFTMKSNNTTIRITWSQVPSATSYRLYLTGDDTNPTIQQFNQNVVTTNTSYNFTGIEGVTYKCILTAINQCGESDPTSVRQVTPCTKPSSVTNLNAICADTLTLTFGPARNAVAYDVAFISENAIIAIFQNLNYQQSQNILFSPSSSCYLRKITITVTAYSECGESSKASITI